MPKPFLNPGMPPESLPDSLGDDPVSGYPQGHPDARHYHGVLPARVFPDTPVNYDHAGVWHTLHPQDTPLTVASAGTASTMLIGGNSFAHVITHTIAIAWTTAGGDADNLTTRYPLRVSLRHGSAQTGPWGYVTNNQRVPLSHLFGSGRRPHRLPRPIVLPKNGSLAIVVENPSAVGQEVQVHMAFVARRRTPLRFREDVDCGC